MTPEFPLKSFFRAYQLPRKSECYLHQRAAAFSYK
jgi:hypothetical protein